MIGNLYDFEKEKNKPIQIRNQVTTKLTHGEEMVHLDIF
jgi:hypothetical protein